MVRGAKKEVVGAEPNPEADERRRLKKLALSKNILSETPATPFAALTPSKTVSKHHGRDLLRKSQRKNKFLFSFPGLLAPITGGKIGELKDLGTKNPILYLDFPQGQMKLFGTIVYPKNRYLTLQFSRGGKNVMCEDYFDIMIVFSDAWWIGRKDENPEEARLEFPKDLNEGQHAEFDFKGGAGATSEKKQPIHKTETQYVEQHSPKTEAEDDLLQGQNKVKNFIEVTPTRHSERTSGKRFNFAEVPSGDDSRDSDTDTSEGEEKKVGVEHSVRKYSTGKRKNSCSKVLDVDSEIASEDAHFSGQVQESAVSITKSTSLPSRNPTSLVQATVSTLFKKVEEKKAPRNPRKSLSSKVSGQSLQHDDSKQKSDEVETERHSVKRNVVIEEKKAGVESRRRKKQRENQDSVEPVKVYQRKTKGLDSSGPSEQASASSQVEEDSIEEFSSTSKDTDGSDEDWAA